MRPKMLSKKLLSFAAYTCTLGCAGSLSPEVVSVRHEFEPADVERLHVRVSMGAGILEVHGCDCGFARAQLRYDSRLSRPRVDYRVNEGQAWLSIEDDDIEIRRRHETKQFELCLGTEVPTAVELELGAGTARFASGNIELTQLEIDGGVGELSLDLSTLRQDARVRVDAGVGEVDIVVPDQLAVDVTVDRGIGELELHGFEELDRDRWRQDGSTPEAPRLALDVNAGVGEIRIRAADG